MTRRLWILALLALLVLPAQIRAALQLSAQNADILQITGRITDSHDRGIANVHITATIELPGAKVTERCATDESGHYRLEKLLSAGAIAASAVFLEARKASYAPSARIRIGLSSATLSQTGSTLYLANADLSLRRIASPAMWISAAVLLMIYAVIGFDLIQRSLAAMLGAALLLGITYLVGRFIRSSRLSLLKPPPGPSTSMFFYCSFP